MSKQEQVIQAEARAKILWAQACRFDGIDPKSKFVSFSVDNPHAQAAGAASVKVMRLWMAL